MKSVCDLLDDNETECQVMEPGLRSFGGRHEFFGPVRTLKVFEDNVLVKRALQAPGEGSVLVVDGGGSRRCALMGDMLGDYAVENGWAGVVIYGCVRDVELLDKLNLGVLALDCMPRKSVKRGEGSEGGVVSFLGVHIRHGNYLYADRNGTIISAGPLQTG